MSIIMNSEGHKSISYEQIEYEGNHMSFFRKKLYIGSLHEHEIVSMIQNNQKKDIKYKNLIRVFNVSPTAYDVELLDLDYCDRSMIIDDIRNSLNLLHSMNVIYIDIKNDNIGYSHIDRKWKIFDFDASGISNNTYTDWIKEAPFYYAYKIAFKQYFRLTDIQNIINIKKCNKEIRPLTQIDDILFDIWQKEEKR